MIDANYAVVYSDDRGTYQVQLFDVGGVSLASLEAKAEKFNANSLGRKALVLLGKFAMEKKGYVW